MTQVAGVGDRLTDEALVAAVVEGSDAAFGVIFRRHRLAVHELASRLVGDAALADDVTQDVFLWFLDRSDRFDPTRGSLAGYLLVRCRSRSFDVLRSETSRRNREQNLGTERCRTPTAWCDAERSAIESENANATSRLLDLLPVHEREVLHLAFFTGRSYRDVAADLNIPEGTAKSRIRSGLRRLRGAMEFDEVARLSCA